VRARRGVVDLPVAGKLVRLLALLAASLAVALTGDRAESGERLSTSPEREREIDEREDVVDPLRLLLGAARREHHRRRALASSVAALTSCASETPVIFSTRSGQ
jgi:hypothetical protein